MIKNLRLATAFLFIWALHESQICAAEPKFEVVRKSVLQVRTYSDGGLVSHGSGFFISTDGKIVTNFHVVEEAVTNGYELRGMLMETTKQEVVLQPWQCWPDFDLAVLVPVKKLPVEPAILKVSSAGTLQGEHVWTVGYPLSSEVGSSVSSGVVSGIRSTAELEALGDGKMALNADAEWVQIDAALNGGNSGGPLVNGEGEVVGINTLKQTHAQNMNFAVHSKSLEKLLSGLSKAPLGYSGLTVLKPNPSPKPAKGDAALPPLQFPVLQLPPILLLQDVKPQDLIAASKQLSDAIYKPCPACKGSGHIEVRSKSRNTDGPGVSRPTPIVTQKGCEACKGRGFAQAKPEAQEKCAARVLNLLCRLEPASKANERVRADAISASMVAMQKDLAFDGHIQKAGLRAMNRESLDEPEPVFGYGYVVGQSQGNGQKRYVLKVHDYELFVIVDQPIEDSRRDKWWSVIFGGMLTSSVDTPQGRMLVIQRGFIRPCAEIYEDAVRDARKAIGL